MAKDLIIVGAGEYFRNLALPSIPELRKCGLIDRVITIDTINHEPISGTSHVVRNPDVSLSSIVEQTNSSEPFVVISHVNQLHTPEGLDVLNNSSTQPRVLIEKPYAIDAAQLIELQTSGLGNPRLGLLEYYLTMKSVPLLLFAGLVKEDTFYFENNGILKVFPNAPSLQDLSGQFQEKVGQPLFVVSEVLEGEGSYGTVEHRNISLIDTRLGGGMIQDLGHHTLSPLLALEDFIGKIDSSSIRNIRTAACNQYIDAAMAKGLEVENIGESYAELDAVTQSGVPIKMSMGKYIENGANQRRIVIVGTKGTVLYDMTNNVLAYQHGDKNHVSPLLAAEKSEVPKYLAVLRSGMEYLGGNNPFTFDPVKVSFTAQELVIGLLGKIPSQTSTYDQGTMHHDIFKK